LALGIAWLITVTGFGLVALGACTISLPYILRASWYARFTHMLGLRTVPWLQRMRPHYWLGITIAVVTVAHALLPLFGGVRGTVNVLGLSLAVLALCLVLPQVNLGLRLRNPKTPERTALRRLHLVIMVCLVVLALGHIALNSPTLHAWLR
jgi:hypothetical protein